MTALAPRRGLSRLSRPLMRVAALVSVAFLAACDAEPGFHIVAPAAIGGAFEDGALTVDAMSLILVSRFDPAQTDFQFVEKADLFAPYLSWHLGIDGIALMLIVLSVIEARSDAS